MTAFATSASDLETFLLTHVPLARAAEIKVDAYTEHYLKVSAPLDKNINDKGTAFGGSLYNVCVIAGWGMTYLKAKEMDLQGDLVIAKAEIEYLRPLKGVLVAEAFVPGQAELDKFKERFLARGKAALTIDVRVEDETGVACVLYKGKYAIVK